MLVLDSYTRLYLIHCHKKTNKKQTNKLHGYSRRCRTWRASHPGSARCSVTSSQQLLPRQPQDSHADLPSRTRARHTSRWPHAVSPTWCSDGGVSVQQQMRRRWRRRGGSTAHLEAWKLSLHCGRIHFTMYCTISSSWVVNKLLNFQNIGKLL